MSDENKPVVSEAAQKYRTIARAVAANDCSAAYELWDLYKDQGKILSDEEVNVLGLRWLTGRETKTDMVPFLKDIGFDFEQNIILDKENENVGTKIPFRLIGGDEEEAMLLFLIDEGCVDKDVTDGMGDGLISEALKAYRFKLADELLQRGLDINATNLYGQSALHVVASGNFLNYQAIQWLGQNGADPTLEDLQGTIPSEVVPETKEDWDTDCVFEVLSNYVDAYRSGGSFEINSDFNEMLEREKGDDEKADQTYGEQAEEAQDLLNKIKAGM